MRTGRIPQNSRMVRRIWWCPGMRFTSQSYHGGASMVTKTWALRPDIRIVQGRKFTPGLREVVVGSGALTQFRGLAVGKQLKLANQQWSVVGVIDADYRGEWLATLRNTMSAIEWERGDRLLQFLIVPVFTPELEVVDSLNETNRGAGGFGSSGT